MKNWVLLLSLIFTLTNTVICYADDQSDACEPIARKAADKTSACKEANKFWKEVEKNELAMYSYNLTKMERLTEVCNSNYLDELSKCHDKELKKKHTLAAKLAHLSLKDYEEWLEPEIDEKICTNHEKSPYATWGISCDEKTHKCRCHTSRQEFAKVQGEEGCDQVIKMYKTINDSVKKKIPYHVIY